MAIDCLDCRRRLVRLFSSLIGRRLSLCELQGAPHKRRIMHSEEIIAAAEAQTGLSADPKGAFHTGLDLLTAALRASDQVPAEGRAMLRFIWTRNLANKLKVEDYHRRHPELADSPVARPVFIMGMPRTGTTLLSNLLAADPARRCMLNWESNDPVPPPASWAAIHNDPRCLAAKARDAQLIAENPEAASRHFEPADAPTECTFIHGHEFMAAMLEALTPAPEYARWLEQEADLTIAYAYEKRFMQVLQHHTGGTWSVKMPSHALFVQSLVKVFPDARIIWTHRDPYKSTASLLSLIHSTHETFGVMGTRQYVRNRYVGQAVAHMRNAWNFERENPQQVTHVHYAQLMVDPIGVMRSVYAALGDEFTPEAELAMRRYLADNPQGKHGSHSYGLDQFGLQVSDLEPHFADYVAHFGVAMEQ